MLDNSGGGGGAGSLEAAGEVVVGVENGGGGGGEEERGKGEGGNRWPREETLALLKIRADMDLAFRDSTLKAPLWDEVSRKLGELGYHRSARKCKEKFENIFKYHKRTKECRSGRQNGKNYRFFEQLARFDNQPSLPSPPSSQVQTHVGETTTSIAEPITIKATSGSLDFMVPRPSQNPNPNMEFVTPSTSTASSSGRESEGSVKKKRKLSDYFEKLMREILEKQENLQNQLLEALEKCERDRIAREEAWRLQQMDRIRKEQEYLTNERAIAAARDATVMAFLQKISGQAIPGQPPMAATPISEKHPDKQQLQTPIHVTPGDNEKELGNNTGRQDDLFDKDFDKQGNGIGESSIQAPTSRWPKTEVEALIRLRTNLGMQFQDNGLKGPLWEEISSAMKKHGYDRSAKRCKEKWENINKYYKRVKESHKRRPESSKTCPYFHMLESIYEKKSRVEQNPNWPSNNLKPEHILMQMMGQQEQPPQPQQSTEDGGSENVDDNREDDAMEEEEEDENGDGYQLVANDPSSVAAME